MADDNEMMRYAIRACLTGLLLGSILVVGTGCEEALNGAVDGPTITSLTITPTSVPKNDTGMTDEFFDVTIRVAGFDAPIEDVELFIAENNRSAPNNPQKTVDITGNTITIDNIQKTWFEGMDRGLYNIGATVTDETGTSDTQRNLAQVEVT